MAPVLNEPIIQSNEYPMYYEDLNTTIIITKERYADSNCFVAHITTSDPHLFKSCFPNDDFKTTGQMTEVARQHNAIFMVNGDYSTVGDFGMNFIIRNGIVCREPQYLTGVGSYFCIMEDGHFQILDTSVSLQEALDMGVIHSFNFYGDNLIKNGEPNAADGAIHPRTFAGEVLREDNLFEYYIVVADGRSQESRGLSNYQEALFLLNKGCILGYNLDGGGSSEMVFDGKILNIPSDGHEREDHDFIYIALWDGIK